MESSHGMSPGSIQAGQLYNNGYFLFNGWTGTYYFNRAENPAVSLSGTVLTLYYFANSYGGGSNFYGVNVSGLLYSYAAFFF